MNTKSNNSKAAIYVRVSREDGDNDISESIVNQKNFLSQYASDKGFSVVDTYSDDGCTGMNMNRPELQRLKRDILSGKINTVITKDTSRLSRSSGDYSYLTEDFFAVNSVRYIAINDDVDTFGSENIMIVFRTAFNEIYPRDISIKVKSSLRAKAKNGEFIGSIAPYGYKKSPFDKNKLIPNEDTAPVVRMIFDMYIAGNGYVMISKELNKLGILSPSAYNKAVYGYNHANAAKFGLWGIDIIRKIILNPVYIGTLVQHKEAAVSIKVKKKKTVYKGEQIVVHDSHESIVKRSVFDMAQALNAKKAINTKSVTSVKHTLSGSIFCGICGSRFTFSKTTKGTHKGEFEAVCSKYKRFSQCERVAIYENELERIVLDNLKSIAHRAIDSDKILKSVSAVEEDTETVYIKKQISAAENKLEDTCAALKSLYMDKTRRVISEDMFLELSEGFTKDRARLSSSIKDLENRLEEIDGKKPAGQYIDILKDIIEFNILTKQVLIALVECIEIYRDRTVIIKYKFKQPN